MGAAIQMSQNVSDLIACFAAIAARPLLSMVVKMVVRALFIPHLVVFCCFSNRHRTFLSSAPLPCTQATMHGVAPVHRFSVSNGPSFGAKGSVARQGGGGGGGGGGVEEPSFLGLAIP
jgi:hypothetical protein